MTDRTTMSITLSPRPAGRVRIVPLCSGEFRDLLEAQAPPLGRSEHARLQRLAGLTRFAAEEGQSLILQDDGDGCWIFVGRGESDGTPSMRSAAAQAVSLPPDGEPWSLVLRPSAGESLVRAAIEGLLLGGYRFEIRSGPVRARAGGCTLVTTGEHGALLERTRATCEGMLLTRDLVNTPACDLGPEELADAAAAVARRHGMRATIWVGEELLERGFRLVEAVGRGSARPSTVTIVEHALDGGEPALALVGKGVVFDSGGLGIKTASGMQLMRKDMGGAGTVIGVLDVLGRLGIDVPLLAVLPSAENAIGPAAFRPGDIIRSYCGRTVEIGHTDAEGRLLLADAIGYARERRVPRLLDLATLTGAARVALGPDVPALFGTDEDMVARLLEASLRNDEMIWRLPLVDAYEKTIDSPWADVCNTSTDKRGGAITAALFLRRFAGDTPWAHVDLYAWEDAGRPGFARGANGMAVRTVVDVLAGLAS